MERFTIAGGLSWYTNPQTGSRRRGLFLSKQVQAYCHADYHGGDAELRETPGTVENIITTLKNQFHEKSLDVLTAAAKSFARVLMADLPKILLQERKEEFTVVAIPRAKAERTYYSNQLLFKKTISDIVRSLKGFADGTDCIIRHTDTRCTHMDKARYGGEGDLPYPGITKDTCTISHEVSGKDVLLIDDLYTASINIDEDAIQALFDNGAKSVTFYALGRTVRRTFAPPIHNYAAPYAAPMHNCINVDNNEDDLPF